MLVNLKKKNTHFIINPCFLGVYFGATFISVKNLKIKILFLHW